MMQRLRLVVTPLPDCEPTVGLGLSLLENARWRILRSINELKPAAVDWSDDCDRHTIGTLLYHIALVEVDWLYFDVLQTDFPKEIETLFPYPMRSEDGRLSVVKGESLDVHLERLQTARNHTLNVFKPMTLVDYRRPRVIKEYDVTPEWVIHHLSEHEDEHRAEIVSLRERFETQN
jgi:hypothetical protein